MVDETLDENIFRLRFPSYILSNIPTFALTISFSWPLRKKSITSVLNIFYLIIHPQIPLILTLTAPNGFFKISAMLE